MCYKDAQSNRMCYTSNNGAQSNRMSIIGEGIEGLVKIVSAFDTPFAPLGLAIGWIKTDYIPFASLRLW